MKATYERIFIPEDCKDKRIKLPSYNVHKLSLTDFEAIHSQLQTNLDQKIPLSVGVCKTKSFFKAATGRCHGHEMAVTGYEKTCCESACVVRYKIQNSDPDYIVDGVNLSGSHEFWIDGDLLTTQMAMKSKLSLFLGGTNLTWMSE